MLLININDFDKTYLLVISITSLNSLIRVFFSEIQGTLKYSNIF